MSLNMLDQVTLTSIVVNMWVCVCSATVYVTISGAKGCDALSQRRDMTPLFCSLTFLATSSSIFSPVIALVGRVIGFPMPRVATHVWSGLVAIGATLAGIESWMSPLPFGRCLTSELHGQLLSAPFYRGARPTLPRRLALI